MSEKIASKLKALQRVYEISVETRNFEITQLTNRNNYYMLFQGVLLAAVFSNQASKPMVEFIITITGILISFYQFKVACGAKFWQEYWELQASEAEKQLKEFTQTHYSKYQFTDLFNIDSNHMRERLRTRMQLAKGKENLIEKIITNQILKKNSVSRTPIYTAIALCLCWILLLLHTLECAMIFDILNQLIVGHYFTPDNKN